MKIRVDDVTKNHAIECADTDAEIYGFNRGSQQWKDSLSKYLKDAVTQMTVGRNPRKLRYGIFTRSFPKVFGINGFADRVAKNYVDQSGKKETSKKDIENRILSSVTNLTKLFENGILGIRTTTLGYKSGEIPSSSMSELQFPTKDDPEFNQKVRTIIVNWILRDYISAIIIELLTPFFEMTKADVEEITQAINLDHIAKQSEIDWKAISDEREGFVNDLHRVLSNKISALNIKDMLLKN